MEKSANMGMQTFDMALLDLYNAGKISFDEAIKNADAANNLRLKIELAEKADSHSASDDEKDEHGGLSLLADEEEEDPMNSTGAFVASEG